NPAIATIDSGGIATGVTQGSATITATALSDTSIQAAAGLTVTSPFQALLNNYSSGEIRSIPYGGGAETVLVPQGTFPVSISGIQLGRNGQSLFGLSNTGTIYELDLPNLQVINTCPTINGAGINHSLSMDPAGNLFSLENAGIYKTDMSNQTTSIFASMGSVTTPMHSVHHNSQLFVCYWGGVAKGTQGGTMQTVCSMGNLITSIDVDSNGDLYVIEWVLSGQFNTYKLTDLNNDGFFFGMNERFIYTTVPQAVDLKVDAAGDLYVAGFNSPNPSPGFFKCRDLNQDGDALDSGETVNWSSCPYNCGVGGGNLTFK
ncbi:MAG: hypothetical protein ACYTFG_14455, partial [Planctomycetota bacterium]